MGRSYIITCRNKECGYHVELSLGSGMYLFARNRRLEEEIKEKRDASEKILQLLDRGEHIESRTAYVCPTCKEWFNFDSPYIFELTHVSPYGTIREYKMHYLWEKPVCKKCHSEIYHILNVLSGKNKCPKCGSDNMNARRAGYID